jgi:Fe-S-cluster-containing dehydrogenase component
MSTNESSSTVTQYGFYFDASRCTGCRACLTSCKSWNQIPAGPVFWARLFQWENGTFPNVRVNSLFAPCYHCANPACVPASNGAMMKEPNFGAVLIDTSQSTGAGLKAAWQACPYGAIAFDSNAANSSGSHCTMCIDRITEGQLPICVAACQMRALDFGKMSDLKSRYPNAVATLPGMPDSQGVQPSVIFTPPDAKKQLVTYDPNYALGLFGNRPSPLPQVFSQPTDVANIPPGLMNKNVLKMKVGSVEELSLRMADDNS